MSVLRNKVLEREKQSIISKGKKKKKGKQAQGNAVASIIFPPLPLFVAFSPFFKIGFALKYLWKRIA